MMMVLFACSKLEHLEKSRWNAAMQQLLFWIQVQTIHLEKSKWIIKFFNCLKIQLGNWDCIQIAEYMHSKKWLFKVIYIVFGHHITELIGYSNGLKQFFKLKVVNKHDPSGLFQMVWTSTKNQSYS